MTNLSNTSDIFADLAQGAYTGRPEGEMLAKPTPDQKKSLKENGYAEYDFSSGGKVYLQPDTTLKTTAEGSKGLLTDSKAGYNSYFVTDTPTLNDSTKDVYFVTRGSDGIALKNANDWLGNNANFALADAYIPQAKLANAALAEKIAEMKTNAKNAQMNVTGHSLGTMISIQAVANLPEGYIDSMGRVVLFQGPDARSSIEKMGAKAKENIEKLEALGKIDYYVNAFDMVS